MLERQDIEVFLTLADELHFGRTAERLRLTTGRVSQTIKKAEREIGTPLFERSSRQVHLTPIGRQLADDLAPHVDGLRQAIQRAVEAGRGVDGVLRVGFLGALAGQLLLQTVHVFTERHPSCEVHILETHWHDAVARLAGGDIDVQFTDLLFADRPGLSRGPVLLCEPLLIALPAGHPLAAAESLTMAQIAELPRIQGPIDAPQRFRADRFPDRTLDGRPVPQGPRAGSFGEALALIAAGHGVFPVGRHAARFYPRPDVAYVPLHDAPPIQWGPIWTTANSGGRVRELIEAAVASRSSR